jgi:N-methylhydantoinase B
MAARREVGTRAAAKPGGAPEIDPVTVEVIRGALETVAYEMATHVSLTATTPILNQSNERNATILDGRGALAALSVGIPQFMLSSTLPVRFALEFFEPEGLQEGDVLVANDPYHGGGHLPDYNVFAPVVRDGELVLIASIQCHHADTGGGMPGGYNAEAIDIWAEGVRFPAVKLYDRGVERRDVTYMLRVNNRTPTFIGDLRAQVGAAQLGAKRLHEIIDRHGVEAVRAAVRHSIAHAERRFREEVSSWPDGVYRADVYVDHDPVGNEDIHVHVEVTVDGDQLTVDFTGSDTREDLKGYSSFGNTRGYVVAQLASMMDPSIPKNEGFFDSIELIVPEGCVLNPAPGKTVAAGTHHPGVEVGEAIAKAMSGVLPERSCPQIYKLGGPNVFVGTHPDTGQLFIDHGVDVLAAYCNAVKGQDGWGSMPSSFGNLIRATAEVNESIFPVRHECCDYQIDTGGPGQWRGCPGSRVVKRVTARLTVTFDTRPEIVSNVANAVPHDAGEAFEYVYGGGGGWGDPLDRDPARVLEDVLDEYVSLQSAERDYGVVLRGSLEDFDLVVDEEATGKLRAGRRS